MSILLYVLFMPFLMLAQNSLDFAKLVNQTHTQRTLLLFDYYVTEIYNKDSTAIFNDISKVRNLAKSFDDKDLMLEADLMELYYFTLIPNYDLTQKTARLSNKADVQNAIWLKAQCESILGNYYYCGKRYEMAYMHLNNAASLLEQESSVNYPFKPIFEYRLGKIHLKFREHQKAINQYYKALESISVYERPFYYMSLSNAVAFSYRKLNLLDSSDLWYQHTFDYALSKDNLHWIALSKGNLGENLYLNKQFIEAKPLLEESLVQALEVYDLPRASRILGILGDIATNTGDMLEAEKRIAEAFEIAHRLNDKKSLLGIYPIAASLHESMGRAELVRKYMDSAIFAKDDFERTYSRMISERSEQELAMTAERMYLMAKTHETEKKSQFNQRNTIVGILILLIIVVWYFFNRNRLKQLKHQRFIQGQKQATEADLALAKNKLQDFVKTMHSKNAELKQIKSELNDLSKKDISPEDALSKEQLQKAIILTEEDWENFKQLFDKVYVGFLAKLIEKHPNISKAETRYIALTKMELSPKQMAFILGVGDSTIRQIRSRLLRKLGLKDQKALVELIEKL